MYLFPSHANTGNDSDNINPNSKQHHHPPPSSPFSFNFPSPNIHYEDDAVFLQHLHDLLHHQQQPPLANMADYSSKSDATKKLDIPRKKTSKKDRHSKINTLRGLRDRRMRLSVDVAHRFFGLQDMLGFDKASKTVEWLLNKSKTAIKELTKVKNSCSVGGTNTASSNSTSECEVLSDRSITFTGSDAKASKPSCIKEKKINVFRRKTAFDHPLARESREKARARARERTRDKMRKLGEESKVIACAEGIMINVDELRRLGSWSPIENGEEDSGSPIRNVIHPSFEMQDQPISCSWSPPTFFDYHHNSGISHEHRFTDFQAYGKPWEAYDK